MKHILLTVDVEEFDLPLEHGQSLSLDAQLAISTEGLQNILNVLANYPNIAATFYTTANYAQHKPELIRALSEKHEIASHTFYHSHFEVAHLKQSKEVLENIIQKEVVGFRMPRLQPISFRELAEAGYQYDSSFCPTWIPGRYNHLTKPRMPYWIDGVLEIPPSVMPLIPVPLFWLAFKNFPLALYTRMCAWSLHHFGFINLYFHPWEFADLSSIHIPSYTKTIDGKNLAARLEKLISTFYNKPDSQFTTTATFLQSNYQKR